MITPQYVRVMAAYNSEINRRVYAAAARLSDAQRREDAGLFFGSLLGTLNHLMWADQMWMHRFDGWERPPSGHKDSPRLFESFDDLAAARAVTDTRIEAWAARLSAADMARDLVWYSGVTKSEQRSRIGFVIMHFFNHQTHHRGQAHAAITRFGEDTGDTDLFLLVPQEMIEGIQLFGSGV
jgi:uncharacterized damage-inducible protein DinB